MVAPAHEHHALIPNADRSALLLAGGRLPVVRVQEPVIRAALTALAREHGVRAPFLRVIRRAEEGEDVTTLLELDAPAEEPRGEWMPLRAVEPSSIAPVLADGVEGWLAEQSGASIPAERPPWARPGWLADACAWVADIAAVRGEPGLVRQWPLSAVYRFDTEADALYLKAVFSLFRHEPAVSAALAREHPGAVPDVVATDTARGWILTRELRGGYARGESACDGLRTAARIHRAWAERADELRSLGCHDRGLGELRAEAPKLAPLCDRLADYGIADSIVHGDLHHGNMLVRDDGVAVIDWSDAAIGQPFLDLAPVLKIGEKQRGTLVDAYVEPWPGNGLREAAAIGEALGCVYQAISYRAINAAFEPDDQWLFANQHGEWMERAHRLAEDSSRRSGDQRMVPPSARTTSWADFLSFFGTSNSHETPFVKSILRWESMTPLSSSADATSVLGERARTSSLIFILSMPVSVFTRATSSALTARYPTLPKFGTSGAP